jgi:hypothetical protein
MMFVYCYTRVQAAFGVTQPLFFQLHTFNFSNFHELVHFTQFNLQVVRYTQKLLPLFLSSMLPANSPTLKRVREAERAEDEQNSPGTGGGGTPSKKRDIGCTSTRPPGTQGIQHLQIISSAQQDELAPSTRILDLFELEFCRLRHQV